MGEGAGLIGDLQRMPLRPNDPSRRTAEWSQRACDPMTKQGSCHSERQFHLAVGQRVIGLA
jgi:hypothetical protein